MSLLDKAQQDVVVYPQEEFEDEDGNILLRPAAVGYAAKAEIQPARQSGTSARRAEQDDEGYFSEQIYRVRFTRQHDTTKPILHQGSQIEWEGRRWSVVGEPTIYMGSPRTAHIDYQMRRT